MEIRNRKRLNTKAQKRENAYTLLTKGNNKNLRL